MPQVDRADLIAQVKAVILNRYQGKPRASNPEWIDCLCPFHEEDVPSASFSQEVGNFYCHAEGQSWGLQELAHRVGLESLSLSRSQPVPHPPRAGPHELPGGAGGSRLPPGGAPTPAEPAVLAPPEPTPVASLNGQPPAAPPRLRVLPDGGDTVVRFYEYRWPNGELSHRIERRDHPDGAKEVLPLDRDGNYRLPDPCHPVFEDPHHAPGDYVLVVEGEQCAVRARKAAPALDRPVRTITWVNGAGSAKKWAPTVADRLSQLDPPFVVLWPDNDDPGKRAMDAMALSLKAKGIKFTVLNPKQLELPPKGDVVDFLDAGGNIAELYAQAKDQVALDKVEGLAQQVMVLSDNRLVYPGTRQTAPIDIPVLEAIWRSTFNEMPVQKQVRELRALLLHRSSQAPVPSASRMWVTPDSCFWRGIADGPGWLIDVEGVRFRPDPPGVFITLPGITPVYPSGVDLEGNSNDLHDLLAMFSVTPAAERLVEAWLLSSLLGLQAPILLIKGAADTGKTTLARALVSLLEPAVIEMQANRVERDPREFMLTLEQTRIVLIDNVSTLSSEMEDTISKMVTGYTTAQRVLYENRNVLMRLLRTVVMTTVTYDVYKSDLASRVFVITPQMQIRPGWHLSDRQMAEQLGPLMPRVRGYLFGRAVEVYRNLAWAREQPTPFRVGDLGLVLVALGEKIGELYAAMVEERKEIMNRFDEELRAIVELWQERGEREGSFMIDAPTLVKEIVARSGKLPMSYQKLAKYVAEKQGFFQDFGFAVERDRVGGGGRVYRFLPRRLE